MTEEPGRYIATRRMVRNIEMDVVVDTEDNSALLLADDKQDAEDQAEVLNAINEGRL